MDFDRSRSGARQITRTPGPSAMRASNVSPTIATTEPAGEDAGLTDGAVVGPFLTFENDVQAKSDLCCYGLEQPRTLFCSAFAVLTASAFREALFSCSARKTPIPFALRGVGSTRRRVNNRYVARCSRW
jgi:hypothetical protein